ncbi:MAG: peptidoglycan-binding protein [Leptolyngbyaceae cyanobacterium]
MTDDKKPQDTKNQGNRNIDWTRKGFGWVPDYPDIRDFDPSPSTDKELPSLQKEIQKEGMTEVIDDLTTDLITAIRLLQESNNSQSNELQETLRRLESRSGSGVQFGATRIYRVLSKDITSKNPDDREQQQEVLQLKKCLYLLIQHGYLSSEKLFKKPIEEVKWLVDSNFDSNTEDFVKQFQLKNRLREDGIVGINTFLKLEECTAKPEECEKNPVKNLNETSTAVKNPAKLVTISSLVPDQLFGELIDQLYLKVSQSLGLSDSLPTILSEDLIIKVLKATEEKIEEISDLEEEIKREKIQVNRNQLIGLCKSEFLIIDPIISVILMTALSPLVNQDSLKRSISDGMDKFEELLIKNRRPLEKSDNAYSNLAQLALLKAQKTLNVEESELIGQIKITLLKLKKTPDGDESEPVTRINPETQESLDQLIGSLVLYSLIDQWLNKCVGILTGTVNAGIDTNEVPLILGKKAIFESLTAPKAKKLGKYLRNLGRGDLNKNLKDENPKKNIEEFHKAEFDKAIEEIDKAIEEEFSKKEHFELVFPTSKGNTQPSQTELHDFFDRPKIALPVSSAASRLKGNEAVSYFLLPGAVDLSFWCSPVEDQGTLNTCTACAGVGLLEYFAKRTFGEFEDLSTLFLYKAARDLRQRFGDVGAPLRDIMRSMILFGVAPERYWPYRPENVDEAPPALCYSYAQNYQTLKYFRLDRADLSPRNLLLKVKAVLAAGFPCMFGFTTYTSIYNEDNIEQGFIPFPDKERERVVGGHSVVAVGYNDHKRLPYPDGTDRPGALLIRNSWGREWGLGGYGWLPYDYVLKGLTGDWWSLLKAEWFGQGYFGLEARDPGGPRGQDQSGGSTSTQ